MSRVKDQWIEETGGFRVGETQKEFDQRQWKIKKIRNSIERGNATAKDIEELAALIGTSDGEE